MVDFIERRSAPVQFFSATTTDGRKAQIEERRHELRVREPGGWSPWQPDGLSYWWGDMELSALPEVGKFQALDTGQTLTRQG